MQIYHLLSFITANFDKYLYLILFVILLVEEAGIPLPVTGDVYIFFAGYQVYKNHADPLLIILDTTIASMIGATLLFLLISKKGEPLVEKYGKYILLSPEKLASGKKWFAAKGSKIILVGRWIPGLRIVLTIVAGLFELQYKKFITAITASTIVWSSAFLVAGIIFAKERGKILAFFKEYNLSTNYIFYLATIILAVVVLYLMFKRNNRKTKQQTAA